jgi:hypothetical protein
MTVIAATLMMLKREENLTGGNRAESVVRVGMTVRKPVTEATPTVHAFLFYLRNAGYAGCPQAFGVDEQGRQVLEFIPGTKVHENGHNAIIDLFHVGVLIRAFHDASASYQAAANAIWNPLIASDGNEIVCHNDLAPWNLIIGPERWAFIDWDNAAPGTRLWDLAWAAVSFPPVETNRSLPGVAKEIRAIGQGYGLDPTEYHPLIATMIARAQAASDNILAGVRDGDPIARRLHAEGHHEYWGPVANYLVRHSLELENRILTSS